MERRRVRRPLFAVGVGLLAIGLSAACSGSSTGTASSGPSAAASTTSTSAPKSLLFVQDAAAATLDRTAGTLTLAGVNSEITYFADRPARTAGHEPTSDFVDQWTDLFGTDPPNAGLQAVDAAGTDQPVVLELLGAPRGTGGTLVFQVKADGATSGAGRQSLRDVSLFIDGGDPAALPQSTPAAAADSVTSHTVTVVNRTGSFQNLMIYQDVSGQDAPGVQPLAWLTAMSYPQSTVTFTWSENYSFVWGPNGALLPGVTFRAAQSIAADPGNASSNTSTFGVDQGSLLLSPTPGNDTRPGSLAITSDQHVSFGEAAVGVAMNGSPVFAAQAQPNYTTVFAVGQPQYFLAAGAYEQGQVLDPQAIGNSLALDFPQGTNDLQAVVQTDGSWVLLPN